MLALLEHSMYNNEKGIRHQPHLCINSFVRQTELKEIKTNIDSKVNKIKDCKPAFLFYWMNTSGTIISMDYRCAVTLL